MTNRLELNWKLDGFVDEQRYYCSETPIDPESLPEPVSILAGDIRAHIDNTERDVGKKYYVGISAVKNSIEKISDEKVVLFGGEWTPVNISKKIWQNASAVIKDSSNRVSQITDQAESNHFVQSVNSRKPIFVSDEIGDGIQFDGVDDYAECITPNSLKITRSVGRAWAFAVIKNGEKATSNCIMRIPANGSNKSRFTYYASTISSLKRPFLSIRRLDSDSAFNTANGLEYSTTYQMLLFEMNYSTATGKVFINGTLSTSETLSTSGLTSNTDSFSPLLLGIEGTTSNTNPFQGVLFENIVGSSALTQSDIDKLFGWAAHKYGLTDNLPVDHPYKILVPTLGN